MYRVPHENLHKVWTRARRLTTESFEWFQLLAWFSVSTCVSRQLKIKSSKMKELERRKVIFSKWQNGTGNRTSCQRFWDLSPNCLQRYQAFEGRVKGEKKGWSTRFQIRLGGTSEMSSKELQGIRSNLLGKLAVIWIFQSPRLIGSHRNINQHYAKTHFCRCALFDITYANENEICANFRAAPCTCVM